MKETNYDRIIKLPPEDLAGIIICPKEFTEYKCPKDLEASEQCKTCYQCSLNYLKEEAE